MYQYAIFTLVGARCLSPGIKIHILLIGDSPQGLPCHAIHFQRAAVELMMTCNAATYRFRDIRD